MRVMGGVGEIVDSRLVKIVGRSVDGLVEGCQWEK